MTLNNQNSRKQMSDLLLLHDFAGKRSQASSQSFSGLKPVSACEIVSYDHTRLAHFLS